MAKESLETLTDTIYEQIKHQKDNPSKKEIKEMLQKIRKIVNDDKLTAEEKDKKMQIIS